MPTDSSLTRDDAIRIEGALTVAARRVAKDAKLRRNRGEVMAPTRRALQAESREMHQLARKVRRMIDADQFIDC